MCIKRRHYVLYTLTVILMAVSVLTGSACSTDRAGIMNNKASRTEKGGQPTSVPLTPHPTGTAHGETPHATSTPSPEAQKSTRRAWNNIHNWAYWLDNPNLQQLGATNFELVVIDYSADGSAKRAFRASQIESLRQSTCARRVVAYLSIGEAESYRGYWQKSWQANKPSWLGEPDPDWEQNYWVRYWEPGWQKIIYNYLDAIIAAGFDGVYLDRIDAYQEDYAAGHEDDMVHFVENIAQYGRTHSPLGNDFGIIVQNAEDLAPDHPDYVRTVTGIGREETYVEATNRPTTSAARSSVEHNLDLFKQQSQAGLVLTIDYASSPALIHDAYQRSRAKGYVPYVANVELNRLQINPGYEPHCD